jgi:hypothetical protein
MVRDAAQEVGEGHSSDEGKDNKTCRSKGPLLESRFYGRRDRVTAHKAQRTPKEKVRVLQRKLYRPAKAQPQRTFGLLYDKVCSLEVLWVAWEQVRRNRAAPGIDGETVEAIEARGVEQFLRELQQELREQRYRPQQGPARVHSQNRWAAATAGHPDAPGIMHLIQFALGMLGGDDLSSRPIFASVDRQRRRL